MITIIQTPTRSSDPTSGVALIHRVSGLPCSEFALESDRNELEYDAISDPEVECASESEFQTTFPVTGIPCSNAAMSLGRVVAGQVMWLKNRVCRRFLVCERCIAGDAKRMCMEGKGRTRR